jgi:hypothetical protein
VAAASLSRATVKAPFDARIKSTGHGDRTVRLSRPARADPGRRQPAGDPGPPGQSGCPQVAAVRGKTRRNANYSLVRSNSNRWIAPSAGPKTKTDRSGRERSTGSSNSTSRREPLPWQSRMTAESAGNGGSRSLPTGRGMFCHGRDSRTDHEARSSGCPGRRSTFENKAYLAMTDKPLVKTVDVAVARIEGESCLCQPGPQPGRQGDRHPAHRPP